MTDVPLREYVDRRLIDLESRIEAATRTSETAINKASEAVDRRLEGMNEFRQAINDQAGTLLTRRESDVWRTAIERDIHSIQRRLDKTEGRGGGRSDVWVWLVAGVAMLVSLFNAFGGGS